jgi:hypothetical protein
VEKLALIFLLGYTARVILKVRRKQIALAAQTAIHLMPLKIELDDH